MRKRPRIGITMRLEMETRRFYLGRDYSDAVEACGVLTDMQTANMEILAKLQAGTPVAESEPAKPFNPWRDRGAGPSNN